MPRFNQRKRLLREIVVEREKHRKVREMRKERVSEETEDTTATGLLQRSADFVSDESESEDGEVLVGEG